MTTPELQIVAAKAGAAETDLDSNPLAPLVMPAECKSLYQYVTGTFSKL